MPSDYKGKDMKGSKASSSSGQTGADCCKGGSTVDRPSVENVSSESAEMGGGGSEKS